MQIDSFLDDLGNALTRANTFDSKVQSDASAISSDYASLVALSVRQAFGATEITASRNSDGSINTSDVLMFMKGSKFFHSAHRVSSADVSSCHTEISSDGVRVFPQMASLFHWLTIFYTEREYRGRHLPELAYIPLYEPNIGKVLASASI